MPERRVNDALRCVIGHLEDGGTVHVVDWSRSNPNARSSLKNRLPMTFNSTGLANGLAFLPVREEELKVKTLRAYLGLYLFMNPRHKISVNLAL